MPAQAQLTDREVLEHLAAARFKDAGSPPNAQYMHGPTGLLSTPGLDPNIVSTLILPTGLATMLPVRLSRETNWIKAILTGMTASEDVSEPTAACADFPEAGNFKLCQQTLPFGRIGRESQILQLDRIGEIVNRGEFLDHRIANNPFASLEAPAPVSPGDLLRNEAASRLVALNVALLRDFADLIYVGNPANTAGSAGYIEYNGLDRQINDGHQDAVTGIACPAADSIIRDFGSVNVATDAGNTVNTITEIANALWHLGEQLGITFDLKLAMRYGAFRALTRIWPCSYLTYRCTSLADGATNFVDAADAVKMRDDMWQNKYLLIDGKRVEVILDEAIAQTGGAGTYVSPIYFLPFGVVGGEPTLYWEYFDMRQTEEAQRLFTPDGSFQVTGNGRYLLHKKPPTNECVKVRLIGRPRLVLRTPFLAARLEDVAYTTYINERSPFPGDPNFYDGGATIMPAPSFYDFVS